MKLELERHVKDAVKKILNKHKAWWFMPPAGIYGKSGIPDFIGILKEKFVAIEAKSPNVYSFVPDFICKLNDDIFVIETLSPNKGTKGLTALQKANLAKIHNQGGIVFVVWDEATLADLDAFLGRILNNTLDLKRNKKIKMQDFNSTFIQEIVNEI